MELAKDDIQFEAAKKILEDAAEGLHGVDEIEVTEGEEYSLSINGVDALGAGTPKELVYAVLEQGLLFFAKVNQDGEE